MKPRQVVIGLAIFVTLGAAIASVFLFRSAAPQWSSAEVDALRALWIGSLPPLPPDPSNAYADDPQAAAFGQMLFFDTQFSANGRVACGTCHLPELAFQDGTPLAQGVGTTNRRTMSIIGTAYSPWLFWDGRKDSQWSQALGPLENAVEHGGNRTADAHLVVERYRAEYEAIFGPLPDLSQLPRNAGPVADRDAATAWEAMAPTDRDTVNRIYANLGKAIAAYERLILPGASRFDRYAQKVIEGDQAGAQDLFSAEESAGLRLFIGDAQCTRCHNGPLFMNNDFHNTGVPAAAGLPEDTGRAAGAGQVLDDDFNCLGAYSDATTANCAELRFMAADGPELVGQFKPPSLRGVADRAPYMHAGQFATLEQVLAHYNAAPVAPVGHTELEPLNLTPTQTSQVVAFLKTLSGPVAADPRWLQRP